MVNSQKLTRRMLLTGLGGSVLAIDTAEAAVVTGTKTVVFDTAAHFEAASKDWVIPLHAWVYLPQQSSVRKAAIAALLRRKYGLQTDATTQAFFDQRINLLLADNKGGQTPQIAINAAADDWTYRPMPKTVANGHTRLEIAYGPDDPAIKRFVDLAVAGPGALPEARAHLIRQEGVSVICDIDDTVKDSGVLDKRRLWESTFFKPFSAVQGMAPLVKRLAGKDAAVHYVSSSPWHLYQPLRSWLQADGFPVSSLHLKHIRLKDSSILDILKSPVETKPPIISALLKRYPGRTFVLVGDSGEKDPEVYGAIARTFPKQVARILIRRAPGDQSGAARFEQAFASLPRDLWQVFDDPSQVA
jgi:hypothetical protein